MLKAPPPILAIVYVMAAAAASYLAGWPGLPRALLTRLGSVLVVIGVTLAGSAIVLFRRKGTEINPMSPANRALVTSGPFRLTRNPMYSGLVTVSLGVACWVGDWPMFLAPVALFVTLNWVHIPFEEEKMRRQFGEAFDAYRAKVGRWIWG